MSDTSFDRLRNLKLILYLFENISSLKINFEKSKAIWLGGSLEDQIRIASIFNCKEGSFPIQYLEIPLKICRMIKTDWIPLIDRMENYLPNWKGSCLSRGERLTLNSVMSSLPSY